MVAINIYPSLRPRDDTVPKPAVSEETRPWASPFGYIKPRLQSPILDARLGSKGQEINDSETCWW
ncbi:hypothetical protein H634G_09071 [Metarhizium anisopliae BRIP 53293]|uniref:Uncharacterized protein n=1 Tax=Metarhizium anisopliae BRIP 53293 TaxID=1291518 RepID=A0A0D9NNR3_METAN|nr:hypothetical protein H634G_09071 [Metarhizium anisopliae BRIP 53293]KJK89279.1 hypothetical protein H633G_06869 [Metarhizium anisopliae BRIP 53284]